LDETRSVGGCIAGLRPHLGGGGFTVGVGNYLLEAALPFETNEIKSIYKLSQRHELADKDLVAALNVPPDRCFAVEEGRPAKVHVIGWGLWALALQHHFCQALTTDFDVLLRLQGLPEEAKKFSNFADQTYDGLRLYPFVLRLNCTEIGPYHKSVDDGFKETVETPHLTPADCWNYICFDVYFAPQYRPIPNPHLNEWHKFNPPPGTAYDAATRLHHQNFAANRQRQTEVHEMAPYDFAVSWFFLNPKINEPPTYEKAKSSLEKWGFCSRHSPDDADFSVLVLQVDAACRAGGGVLPSDGTANYSPTTRIFPFWFCKLMRWVASGVLAA
jgi:hypothetical protein